MRVALASGLMDSNAKMLDYGCGRGDDLRTLRALGFDCEGWDPAHRPDGNRRSSDLVNLGYVVNVIEHRSERIDTLRSAWSLTQRVLVVAARVDFQEENEQFEDCSDGVLTGRGTFQKFYTQPELRDWIDDTLDVLSVAAGPGIFFVFREEEDRQRFSSSLFRRRLAAPIGRISDSLFDENRELLQTIISFYEARGRVPQPDELPEAPQIIEVFGSIVRAFRVVRNATGENIWNEIEDQRHDDLLVYIELQRFRKRPRFSPLPFELRHDIKSFWGHYTAACAQADELLFSVGNLALVSKSCAAVGCGKVTPEALYIHADAPVVEERDDWFSGGAVPRKGAGPGR